MKTKKVLLGSLALAGVFGACTNEEIVDAVQNNAALTERTQVNLTLETPVASRMSNGTGWGVNYETRDVLGAVLVDAGYSASENWPAWNNVNWSVVDGHVGNNRWAYKDGKFQTDGTTAVGAWVFYTKYNADMTTSRNGIEFDFPQIQDGAADLEKIANNNINFMVSPVAKIDGYEGQNLNFNVAMSSVFNYLRMPFDFSAIEGVTKVQKIVVSAKTAEDATFKFPTQYKVVNKNLPIAKLSLNSEAIEDIKCTDLNIDSSIDVDDQNQEMANAIDTLTWYGINWDEFDAQEYASVVTSRNTAKDVDYLVVDLDEEHTDKAGNGGLAVAEDGKFSAMMLMPAGVYQSITFEIYTDNGVYTKTVDCRNVYEENDEDFAPIGKNVIFLRPNTNTVLSDVENKLTTVANTAATLTDKEYIKVTTDDKTDGDLITKTADLINFINGITAEGSYDANVLSQDKIGDQTNGVDDEEIPAHSVIVNQAVMSALEAKEKEVGDIQLVFKGAKILVKGNATSDDRLNIHDLTFTEGCDLTEGYVKVDDQVIVPQGKTMLVKNGVNTTFALVNNVNEEFNRLEIENGAKVITTTTATLYALNNKGTLNVSKNSNISVDYIDNSGTTTLTYASSVLNAKSFVNQTNATVENKGTLTVTSKGTNSGTLKNNKQMNVQGTFTNNASIEIAADAKIHVNNNGTASFTNAAGATVVNKGMLYTKVGYNNTIQNLGVIEAKDGSTTYITKNSKLDEEINANGTTGEGQTMGTIKIEKRDTDISVTEANFQGYKEYTVADTDLTNGKLTAVKNDKFNKVILNSAAELGEDVSYVNFVVAGGNLTLPKGARIQEATFTANASLYAEPATGDDRAVIGKLTVNENVLVKVPTENAIYVYSVIYPTSYTQAAIVNKGEILVGGDLYTSLTSAVTTNNGEFSAGDGNATAFHWSTAWK